MSKSKRKPISLGSAVALSLLGAVLTAIAFFVVLWFMPNSPAQTWVRLVEFNNSPSLPFSALYLSLLSELENLQMYVASPLSMLVGGIVLGMLMGEEYGTAPLYRWAAGCGTFINLICLLFLWGDKIAAQGMKVKPGQIGPQYLSAQMLALIFWIGLYIIGAEIGRRFHNVRTRPVTAR